MCIFIFFPLLIGHHASQLCDVVVLYGCYYTQLKVTAYSVDKSECMINCKSKYENLLANLFNLDTKPATLVVWRNKRIHESLILFVLVCEIAPEELRNTYVKLMDFNGCETLWSCKTLKLCNYYVFVIRLCCHFWVLLIYSRIITRFLYLSENPGITMQWICKIVQNIRADWGKCINTWILKSATCMWNSQDRILHCQSLFIFKN